MAFDATLPQSTTTIRNLSTVIPDNWAAIASADSSFSPDGFNFAQQGSALGALATTFRLFSQASGGNTELFGINSNGDITQFTSGSPTLAIPGSMFLPGGILVQWGYEVNATDNVAISFGTAFSAAAYYVGLFPVNNVSTSFFWCYLASLPTASAFTPNIKVATTSGGFPPIGGPTIKVNLQWIAIGAA